MENTIHVSLVCYLFLQVMVCCIAWSSEMLISNHHTTWHNNPEYHDFYLHYCENFKPHILILPFLFSFCLCSLLSFFFLSLSSLPQAAYVLNSPQSPLCICLAAVFMRTICLCYAGSCEQSPRLLEAYGADGADSDGSAGPGETQLREDLADAMMESPGVPTRDTGNYSMFLLSVLGSMKYCVIYSCMICTF